MIKNSPLYFSVICALFCRALFKWNGPEKKVTTQLGLLRRNSKGFSNEASLLYRVLILIGEPIQMLAHLPFLEVFKFPSRAFCCKSQTFSVAS